MTIREFSKYAPNTRNGVSIGMESLNSMPQVPKYFEYLKCPGIFSA